MAPERLRIVRAGRVFAGTRLVRADRLPELRYVFIGPEVQAEDEACRPRRFGPPPRSGS